METIKRLPADHIVPLSINGLEGRMLRLPAAKASAADKQEILFVYGHHSSLERWWGLMEVFAGFGNVTMPDLPGFGGMDSFFKIGRTASIDNMADYLAAFIKWRYKRKRLMIVGLSFGFVVVTRMLQRYPELAARVDMLISIVGFAHQDDFIFTKRRLFAYRAGTRLLSVNPLAWLFRHSVLTAPLIRAAYGRTYSSKAKSSQATSPDDLRMLKDIEVKLWQENDVRTHMSTASQFLHLDNCQVQVDLPVWHVYTEADHYFNHAVVEQHLRVIFSDFYAAPADTPNHAPSVIADAEAAALLLPQNLRAALSKLP